MRAEFYCVWRLLWVLLLSVVVSIYLLIPFHFLLTRDVCSRNRISQSNLWPVRTKVFWLSSHCLPLEDLNFTSKAILDTYYVLSTIRCFSRSWEHSLPHFLIRFAWFLLIQVEEESPILEIALPLLNLCVALFYLSCVEVTQSLDYAIPFSPLPTAILLDFSKLEGSLKGGCSLA